MTPNAALDWLDRTLQDASGWPEPAFRLVPVADLAAVRQALQTLQKAAGVTFTRRASQRLAYQTLRRVGCCARCKRPLGTDRHGYCFACRLWRAERQQQTRPSRVKLTAAGTPPARKPDRA